MRAFLKHFFLPSTTNNFKAKLIHHDIVLLFIAFFLSATLLFNNVKISRPDVLGISSNITMDQLLQKTNEVRAKNGLSPLTINSKLVNAASGKARDMFTKNYWAHFAPDGTSPWDFFKGAGYDYIYAGENLARGFTETNEVMDAWMASPTHRKNILSENYEEIGFSIQAGQLNGEDTVLVVELFGSGPEKPITKDAVESVATVQNVQISPAPTITKIIPVSEEIKQDDEEILIAGSGAQPVLDSKDLSKNFAALFIAGIVAIFAIDLLVLQRKKVTRIAGHNLDHLLFLSLIAILIFIFTKGSII